MKDPHMQFNQCHNGKKKSYDSHMNANVKENAIQMCSQIKAPSLYNDKNMISFHYHINFFLNRVSN